MVAMDAVELLPMSATEYEADGWVPGFSGPTGVAEAAHRLGVTPAVLRKTLRLASAGPDALEVKGLCAGRRFSAKRPRAGRGVPWQFSFAEEESVTTGRINALRTRMESDPGSEHRSLPVKVLRRALQPFRSPGRS
jgi:hypothetical protein